MDWLNDLLAVPRLVKEIHKMGEKTEAALAELSSSVDEVAAELEQLAANTDDQATADQILPIAERLRGLRPDDVPVDPPVEPQPV